MNKEFQTLRKKQRFSLRKLNIGVASVLLGFTIFGYNLASQAPVAHAATSAATTPSAGSSATGVASGSPASNSRIASATSSAATASQATPATQVPANQTESVTKTTPSAGSPATGVVSGSQASNSQAASATSAAATASQATSSTQVTVPAASQSSESANSGNATSSTANQAGTVSANQTSNTSAAGAPASNNQTVTVDETTLPATQAAILSTNLARLTDFKVGTRQRHSAMLLTNLAMLPNSETATPLPTTTQTYEKVVQPLLYDYMLHTATGTRYGKTWVDKTVADYPGNTLDTIFGTTSNPGIIPSNTDDKYFFAAYVDYSERYHRVILLARSQKPSDKNLYSYTIHTYWQKHSTTTTKPGESTKEQYNGIAGIGNSTYDLIFHNYGDSFTVKLSGFTGGWGLLPVFDSGLLDPTYGSNTLKQNDDAAKAKSIGFWASAIPQETSTKVRYVDQATGKDIVQPMEISGFGYQGFKVKGEAPTVPGYQLVSKPKFLGLPYEDGTIAPYKVGQTYDLALSDSVVIKQTVIHTDGTVRATAYYNGRPLSTYYNGRSLSTSTSKVLGRESNNDTMSFGTPDGKWYTYTNRIGQVDDSYIYYYAKDGDLNGSDMRLHFIDVTGVNNSSYAPSDGPELDVDKVQTIHGNIGENYSFTYTVPKGYDQVGSSDVTGKYSGTHHDAYVYVKKQAENKLYAPVASDPLTVEQGTTLTTEQAKAAVKYNGDVPSDATYAWDPKTPVDTATVGSYTPNVIVTYGDGTTSPVTVTVNVVAKTDKGKYTVAAGQPVNLTHGKQVQTGDSLDSSAVTLTDAKGQPVSLPAGAKVVWTEAPDTREVGDGKTGQAKVVYGDQTESEPVTVTYNVKPNDADQADLKPGKQVKVDDPAKLTDDEKGQVSAGITTANPTAPIKSIKVNDDGSATVTFNDDSTKTVPSNVVKTDKSKYTVAAGQPVNLTHGKQVQTGDSLDSSAVTLTDAKGQPVSLPAGAKVVWTEAPDTREVGDGKTGQAKVVYGDQTESEPVTVTYNVKPNDAESYHVTAKDDVSVDKGAQVDPGSLVKVTDPAGKPVELTPGSIDWKDGAKPDLSTSGDKTGEVEVTLPDGSKTDVPVHIHVNTDKGDTTDAGNITPTIPGGKVTVKDPSHLTDDEKNQVKNNVDNANKDKFPAGTDVTVGDDGTATVNYPDGSKDTIPGDQLVQGQKGDTTDAGNITPTIPGGKVTVKDPSHLTDDEKNQVKKNVEDANKDKFPDGTVITVGDDGTTTVTYPDGSKDVIAGTDLVIAPKSEDVLGSKYHSHKNGSNSSQADRVKGASTANGSIANAGNNLGVKAETDNVFVGVKGESDNAIGNNKATSLKTLPQTGTKDTSILGVLGMLLASLGLFVFKKKRDKE